MGLISDITAPSHDAQTGLRFLFKVRPVFVVWHTFRLRGSAFDTERAVKLSTVAAAATMEENGAGKIRAHEPRRVDVIVRIEEPSRQVFCATKSDLLITQNNVF